MRITDFLKRAFNRNEIYSEQIGRLKGLHGEQLKEELGVILYEMCVRYATDFVNEELNRKESPFRGLNRHKFFHEIAVLSFWMADKVVVGKKKTITEEIHKNYFNSLNFHLIHENNTGAIFDRYRVYYDSWNDVTGHQDIFGMKAAEFIFDGDKDKLGPGITFWLISYADSTMKTLSNMKRIFLSMGIKI